MAIEGRTWNNSDGKRNFPSGEIFTGPVEDSVEGHVRFTFPVVTGGREVSDVRIRFAGGKVVEASAGKNEDVLIAALDTDEGARYLGEIAFGTNFGLDRFTKKILLDEKSAGRSTWPSATDTRYRIEATNPAIHWDLICDIRQGGRVTVDREDSSSTAATCLGGPRRDRKETDLPRFTARFRGLDPRIHDRDDRAPF